MMDQLCHFLWRALYTLSLKNIWTQKKEETNGLKAMFIKIDMSKNVWLRFYLSVGRALWNNAHFSIIT